MNINWTTFFLEIINFLVLVWLLKRFFYRPVRNMIDKRRETIALELQQANTSKQAAEEIQKKYENRDMQWQSELQQMRAELQNELQLERKNQLDQISVSINQEKEKQRAAFNIQLQQELHEKEQQVMLQGARFAAKLLKNFDSPDIENALIQMLLESLEKLPEEQQRILQALSDEDVVFVKINTARDLSDEFKRTLQEKFSGLLGAQASYGFAVNPALIAGVRVNVGPLVFRANLEDELQYFAEAGNGHG